MQIATRLPSLIRSAFLAAFPPISAPVRPAPRPIRRSAAKAAHAISAPPVEAAPTTVDPAPCTYELPADWVVSFKANGDPIWNPAYVERYEAKRAAQKVDSRTGKLLLKDRRKPWQKALQAFSVDRTGCIVTPRWGPRD